MNPNQIRAPLLALLGLCLVAQAQTAALLAGAPGAGDLASHQDSEVSVDRSAALPGAVSVSTGIICATSMNIAPATPNAVTLSLPDVAYAGCDRCRSICARSCSSSACKTCDRSIRCGPEVSSCTAPAPSKKTRPLPFPLPTK